MALWARRSGGVGLAWHGVGWQGAAIDVDVVQGPGSWPSAGRVLHLGPRRSPMGVVHSGRMKLPSLALQHLGAAAPK